MRNLEIYLYIKIDYIDAILEEYFFSHFIVSSRDCCEVTLAYGDSVILLVICKNMFLERIL